VEARMSERSEFAGRPPPVREAQVTDRRSRAGERFGLCFLLVTLISHSAAEERFFAQAKKSDSAAAKRMSKPLLTLPLAETPSWQSREVRQGGLLRRQKQKLSPAASPLGRVTSSLLLQRRSNQEESRPGPMRFSRRWGTARKLASLRHAGLGSPHRRCDARFAPTGREQEQRQKQKQKQKRTHWTPQPGGFRDDKKTGRECGPSCVQTPGAISGAARSPPRRRWWPT